jgi:ribonucleoside-diphosphate reductase alpha chain
MACMPITAENSRYRPKRDEITRKRRHGLGFLGLGSTVTMLRMKYGEEASVKFTGRVSRELALTGWQVALDLAREKGPAPIMEEDFEVTEEMLRKRPEMRRDGYLPGDSIKGKVLHMKYSRYMRGNRCALYPSQLDCTDRDHLPVTGQQCEQRH